MSTTFGSSRTRRGEWWRKSRDPPNFFEFFEMRSSLTLIFTILFLNLPLLAAQVSSPADEVLGVYEGRFKWDYEVEWTPIRFSFTQKTLTREGDYELRGSGEYLAGPATITIQLRAHYQPATGAIEIWESEPDSYAEVFQTNGSHVGTLQDGELKATWITAGTSEKGHLSLKRVKASLK